jgi:hypothetical protein
MKKFSIKEIFLFLVITNILFIIYFIQTSRSGSNDIVFYKSFFKKKVSQKKNILFAFGTRPEIIKLFPIIKEFKKHKRRFFICLTGIFFYSLILNKKGQHDQKMINPLLTFFNINPDCNLNLLKFNSKSQSSFISHGLSQIQNLFSIIQFDYIIVHGFILF